MTKIMAQRRADKLRQANTDPHIKFEVEPEHERSRRYVVGSYRRDQPTGTTYFI